MDKQSENSEKPEEKKLREISDKELKGILEEHKKWVESEGEKEIKGAVAALHSTNLKGINLYKANLQHADLLNANLEGAYIVDADLQGALLNNANLNKATLANSNLNGANLLEANLEETHLNNAYFRGATLAYANLTNVKITGDEFAGADITGAELPEDIKEFKTLEVVEESSKNARKIFLALLLGCAYSWLTMLSTTDVGLLTNSASSPLPIIRTAIPIGWFYFIAPILLAGFYLYLHLYLNGLWKGLSKLPAIFEDGKPLDERAYPWMVNSLVCRQFEILKKNRSTMARLKEQISIILVWWVVPITLIGYWFVYIKRHDWNGTIWHLLLIMASIVFGIFSYRSHKAILGNKKDSDEKVNLSLLKKVLTDWNIRKVFVILSAVILVLLSTILIEVQLSETTVNFLRKYGYTVYVNFSEKDISTRPDNYWLIDPARCDSIVSGANLVGANLRFANAKNAFLRKADLSFANLGRANLEYSDLKNALLYETNLEGANLWRVDLKAADLTNANFEGADLSNANLEKTCLQFANLRRANLRYTKLWGADLEGAIFKEAILLGTDLSNTKNLKIGQLTTAFWDSYTIWPYNINADSLRQIQDSVYWHPDYSAKKDTVF